MAVTRGIAHLWRRHGWLIIGLLWIVALALGYAGFSAYTSTAGQPAAPLDLAYLTLQLISMNSGAVEPPVPWPLQVSRFLIPLLAAWTVVRALVERNAPQLLDSQGRARIDEGVLRALLRVPAYRPGARSLQAILDMSALAGRKRWDQAALPSAEQLALHVDADLFTRLVLRGVLLAAARDPLGEAVHDTYRKNQAKEKSPDDPSMRPWSELAEDLKESNRQQADHILEKLRAIGYGIRPMAGEGPTAI
jgi:hypothetical protein